MFEKVRDSLYKIKTERPSCTSYLILDDQKNVLIDPGLYQKYDLLCDVLDEIGIHPSDIDIVLNTHEHADHIGANKYFQRYSTIMTHRYAATKIINSDDEILHCRGPGDSFDGYKVHMWLENNNIINLDDWCLKTIYTPGHTSGCVCFYEAKKRLLFSGDTILANGIISHITDSGSYGEYLNSLTILNNLKIDMILPGHGVISTNIEEDIQTAIENADERNISPFKKD